MINYLNKHHKYTGSFIYSPINIGHHNVPDNVVESEDTLMLPALNLLTT